METRFPYFDAHCDTLSRCLRTGESLPHTGGQCDLTRLSRYRPFGQVFAIFHDSAKATDTGQLASVEGPGVLLACARRQAALFQREKARYGALCAERDEPAGRLCLSVEGAELLLCDPERLEEAKAWGVRSVNLTWNHANALSGSHMEQPDRGLTDRGRVFVRRAGELGIFPDVSHLSDPGFYDLAEMSVLPLFASHSNSRALCPHTRNLTDDQFRLIRDSGGITGVSLYTAFTGGDGSMEALLRHFDHFLELGGEHTLALGSDWDGGITDAGGLSGVEDMGKLYSAMLARGYGGKLARDIFYGNLARFLGFPAEP